MPHTIGMLLTSVAVSSVLESRCCWLESFIAAKMLTGIKAGRSEDKRLTGRACETVGMNGKLICVVRKIRRNYIFKMTIKKFKILEESYFFV